MTWITDADKKAKTQIILEKLNPKLLELKFQQDCKTYLPTIEASLKYIEEDGGLKYQKIFPPAVFDPNQTQVVSAKKYSIIWKIWIPNHNSNGIYMIFNSSQISFICQINSKITRKTTLKEINQAGIVGTVKRWFKIVYLRGVT